MVACWQRSKVLRNSPPSRLPWSETHDSGLPTGASPLQTTPVVRRGLFVARPAASRDQCFRNQGALGPTSLSDLSGNPPVLLQHGWFSRGKVWEGEIPSITSFTIVTPLTSRENDVLRLICDGLSNREIGQSLHIAETTARDHVHAVIRKMNARNRTACAVEGIRRQLVS
ncbi:MAG: LuxR C-terminal-related transcriptional regulator [Cyanobacteriota bacterium]|nr:LuxR C-terminal-related transcriptional regulator [Cyanobacteriota bacterium]